MAANTPSDKLKKLQEVLKAFAESKDKAEGETSTHTQGSPPFGRLFQLPLVTHVEKWGSEGCLCVPAAFVFAAED